ncbi:Mad3/BUB1 homology region 1-domain-containing protein [Trametes maxima]|nr:Mad3/BUB1 homology region 1-domain-containing protein [Trametes maxima]
MDAERAATLAKERANYRDRLAVALKKDADPLATYYGFVKWTVDAYKDNLGQSGLIELLDEATRHFVDDDAYRSDLRYLRLWLLYARHVEDPIAIYAFLLSRNIGKIYAQTYQEYAEALRQRGKLDEADKIFQLGIQRRARPIDPLKSQYEEFKARTLAPKRDPPSNGMMWKDAPAETRALRSAPLKNHLPKKPPVSSRSSRATQNRSSSSSAPAPPPQHQLQSDPNNPYGLMLAPPPPGKRLEKLRVNLSLLFTEDGVEYSMQEARARSMGLLGKKWGQPKDYDAQVRGAPEPTVTLATKEALRDVFGMYNSPDKTSRYTPGSKHVPLRSVVPVTPMTFQPLVAPLSDENAQSNLAAKTPTFRPFVDENARRENQTPAPAPKMRPFVDPENANVSMSAFTPNLGRPALSSRDPSAPSTGTRRDENANSLKKLVIHTDPEGSKPPPVFSLTPASATYRDHPQGRWENPTDDPDKTFRPPARPENAGAVRFTPFTDENAPKVFSRPVPKSENASIPVPTFTPFVEKSVPPEQPLASTSSGRPVLGERTPLRAVFAPPPTKPEPQVNPVPENEDEQEQSREVSEPDTPTTESEGDPGAREQFELERQQAHESLTSESSEDADDDDYDRFEEQEGYAGGADEPVPIEGGEDSMFDEGYDYEGADGDGDDTGGYRGPLGGRLGQFDVMTPITERTFEYTMSTRGSGTPNGLTVHRDAVEAAVQLAAELQEDRDDDEDESQVDQIEERTGTLSLADALGVASSFKPSNPCNPFDPPIVSTLLRLIPPDAGFHDLRVSESQRLDAMQKFAKKKTRRASGNSTSSRTMQDTETFDVQLQDRHFGVVDKLGEGGFGTVFEAVDLDLTRKNDSEDEDDYDYVSDDEDGEKNRVALKVVKPRNLWEFHVLRRIHNTLPAPLRRSIIAPQALYAYKDESFLVLELCKQGTLLDIVNRAPAAGITQQGACLDELLVMFFSVELLRLLEGLHRAGFIHGDVKIDNCLLRLEDVPGPASAWEGVYQPSGAGGWAHKGIKLIDFGRTIDTRLFPAGQRYVAEWPTDARDCFEAREGRPWTYQTDYYGLAGIIYCLLYGKYIEVASVVPASAPSADGKIHYRLATPFKRYWQGELWTRLFDLLLNPTLVRPDGKLPVSDELGALRGEMEAWLQANCNRASNSLKGLLKKVGLTVLGGKDAR